LAKLSGEEIIMAEGARENESGAADSNAWFFTETSLDDLLANAKPLTSLDDLALDDLTPEEACSFLRAVEE